MRQRQQRPDFPKQAASPEPEDSADPIVRQAVEAGLTFFDTADMYSGGVSEITGRLDGDGLRSRCHR
jgi:aryl-alcohol dehydrogenase-like predicted oxidoreductase